MAIIKADGVTLAAPTEIKEDGELIWSSSTGRTASGLMTGKVVAEKGNYSVTWEYLKASEYEAIKKALSKDFFSCEFNIGVTSKGTFYRGSISATALGTLDDGIFYFKKVTATLTQQ